MYGLLRNLPSRVVPIFLYYGNVQSLRIKCRELSSNARNRSLLSLQSPGVLKRKNCCGFLVITRSMEHHEGGKFSSFKTLKKLQVSDGVPPKYEMIYRTDLGNYLMGAQGVVFLALFAVFGSLIIKYVEWLGVEIIKKEDENKPQVKELTNHEIMVQDLREALGVEPDSPYLLAPKLEELTDGDPESLYLILLLSASLLISLYRMQRRIPIRIYTNSTGHCMSVYYSSVLPGRTRVREFVAGTLKSMENPRGYLWSHCVYKDGSGAHMILMQPYFRNPQDFYNLLQKEDVQNQGSANADGS